MIMRSAADMGESRRARGPENLTFGRILPWPQCIDMGVCYICDYVLASNFDVGHYSCAGVWECTRGQSLLRTNVY